MSNEHEERKIHFSWDGMVPKSDGPAKATITFTDFSADEGMSAADVQNAITSWVDREVYQAWLCHADFFGHQHFTIEVINGDTGDLLWRGRGTTDNF